MNNMLYSNVIAKFFVCDDDVKNEILRLMSENQFYNQKDELMLSMDGERLFIQDSTVVIQMYAHNLWSDLNYFEFWDEDFDPILNCNCGYTATKQHEDYLNLMGALSFYIQFFINPSGESAKLSSLIESAIASHRVELDITPYGFDITPYGFDACSPMPLSEFTLNGKILVYFNGCAGTDVEIPEGIEEISNDAFAIEQKKNRIFSPMYIKQLYKIDKVTFPKSLTKIGDRAFYKCNLKGEIRLYSKLSSIGTSAFEKNVLESVIMEDGVKKIDKLAFANMPTLTHATIPASVKKIGEKAFDGCPNLVICTPRGS